MARHYKKKTDRQPHTPRKLKKAIGLARDGYSLRVAAKETNVKYGCLYRICKKLKDINSVEDITDTSSCLIAQDPCFRKKWKTLLHNIVWTWLSLAMG